MDAFDFLNLPHCTLEKESEISVVFLYCIFQWKQMDIFSMKND